MTYHVPIIFFDDDWSVSSVDENDLLFGESRTLDEAVPLMRDLIDPFDLDRQAELRLIVPADLPLDDSRRSGRFTHAVDGPLEAEILSR
jgi:hypothetical protein